MSPHRRRFLQVCLNLALVFLSLAVTLGAGEVYFRIRHARRGHVSLDGKLGWKPTPGYVHSGLQQNLDGSTYEVSVSQDDQGFRLFSHPGDPRPKLLVIGDSFTQAVHVSDDRTYYALLGRHLNVGVTAYGLDGAGSLQEYMVLDRYLEKASPDLILWQYCSNDLVNNSFALETNSIYNNNAMVRPYLEGGAPVYRLPKPYPGMISFLVVRSYLARFVVEKLLVIQASTSSDSIEREMSRLGPALPEFAESVETTARIMAMVKRRAGSIPVVTFECDFTSPRSSAALRQISQDLSLPFIDEVDEVLAEAKATKAPIYVADGAHWNEAGHALLAGTIGQALKARFPWLTGAGRGDTYDFLAHLDEAGMVCALPSPDLVRTDHFIVNGDQRPVLFAHPPSRICYRVSVTEKTVLAFDVATAPGSWEQPGDGVTFEVYAESGQGSTRLYSGTIDPKHDDADRRWHPHRIDLGAYAGQTITLIFETGAGPAGDDLFDWAGWGLPRLTEP